MNYKTPFSVRKGVIYDADGRKAKLWGVNYYAPFNHNFYNIEELGKDHFKAIDEDIRHLKLLGADFIRMHLYDREITDRGGNIVENKNMRVLDYLIDQCEKNGIFLMITPTVWWNTVKNQIFQDRVYAYWYLESQDAFGFSNYFSVDAMIWDSDAIQCQKVYLNALFSRKNTVSGKRMNEYSNIVSIELFNEPQFPSLGLTRQEPDENTPDTGALACSRGPVRRKLIRKWEEFRAAHPEESDEEKAFSRFRIACIRNYFETLWPVVDEYFGKHVIKAQFPSYSGLIPEDLKELFDTCSIDALTLGTYLNADGFDSTCTDSANHLTLAKQWFERYETLPRGRHARIAYEFDASSTGNGYPLAAIAAEYARHDVQMAAYFTYTPYAAAAWNPGWLVHFLNIAHTPSRAAGFAAAGELFRNNEPGDPIEFGPESWQGKNYRIERRDDRVIYKDEHSFFYSNSNTEPLENIGQLERVVGRGNSLFAECSGNGCYFLEKKSDRKWSLTLMPKQAFMMDPGRGKSYRRMANRYVNCRKEPPVSMLFEEEIDFRLIAKKIVSATTDDGKIIFADADGNVRLAPGEYTLEVEG
ncbi:MAG: hypothetical protein BWY31_04201 [Lentisphaerae bacterium ADurb.Bin242]|nr:MAG: hypothetical protein BWY31_04201 [Lentisphaerae bacterium ADurb.Bin242]